MGLTEWMLTVDSRKTRTLHGGTCIQFLLHFKGIIIYEIGGSHSGVECLGLLRYDTISISKFQLFQKSLLPPTLEPL